MKYIQKVGLVSLVTLLASCGDNYPKTGKWAGGIISPQQTAKYTTVYAIDPNDFNDWKSTQAQLKDLSSMSEDQLLAVKEEILTSQLVQENFNAKLLLSKDYNIDEATNSALEHNKNTINNLKGELAKLEQSLTPLIQKKETSEAAVKQLEKVAVALKAETEAYKKEFHTLQEQVGEIYSQFTKKDTGSSYDDAKKRAMSKYAYNYDELKKADSTCEENIHSTRKSVANIFADKTQVGDKVYCAYFKSIGFMPNNQKKILAKLTDKDIALIKKAAVAKLLYSEYSDINNSKIRNIKNSHKKLYDESKSFSYKDKSKLNLLSLDKSKLTKQLEPLLQATEASARKQQIELLTDLLNKAKWHYLYEKLGDGLTVESQLQPDGNFSLESGEDYYLMVFDRSDKSKPHSMKFALLRMKEYENLAFVPVSPTNFFEISDLSGITL